MTRGQKLATVKIVHSLVWLFYNVVIGYLVYAVASDKIDKWVWICLGLVAIEGLVLLAFKYTCPLTLVARRFSESTKDNFDIFLPNWLARHNKLIYATVVFLCLLGLVYRLAG